MQILVGHNIEYALKNYMGKTYQLNFYVLDPDNLKYKILIGADFSL